jgi:hypothetical protein
MPIAYSRFPASVVTSDGTTTHRGAVVVIDGDASLAVQVRSGDFHADEVQVIATLTGVTVGNPGPSVTLTGDDGQTWQISEGDGCSCRSPLLAWYQMALRGQPAGT